MRRYHGYGFVLAVETLESVDSDGFAVVDWRGAKRRVRTPSYLRDGYEDSRYRRRRYTRDCWGMPRICSEGVHKRTRHVSSVGVAVLVEILALRNLRRVREEIAEDRSSAIASAERLLKYFPRCDHIFSEVLLLFGVVGTSAGAEVSFAETPGVRSLVRARLPEDPLFGYSLRISPIPLRIS
jgi:hypothetical protein